MKGSEHGRDLLKVIYYARELAPSRNSNVERIEFWGPAIDKQVDRPIVASKDTWDRLRDLSESLRNEGEYIEIVGIIRALDLDKKTCRVKTLAIKDSDLWLDEINCELGDDLEKNDEEFLEQAKRPLMINGVLHYTDKGDVSKLVIDEICEQVSSL